MRLLPGTSHPISALMPPGPRLALLTALAVFAPLLAAGNLRPRQPRVLRGRCPLPRRRPCHPRRLLPPASRGRCAPGGHACPWRTRRSSWMAPPSLPRSPMQRGASPSSCPPGSTRWRSAPPVMIGIAHKSDRRQSSPLARWREASGCPVASARPFEARTYAAHRERDGALVGRAGLESHSLRSRRVPRGDSGRDCAWRSSVSGASRCRSGLKRR